jgi:hypothetical protein
MSTSKIRVSKMKNGTAFEKCVLLVYHDWWDYGFDSNVRRVITTSDDALADKYTYIEIIRNEVSNRENIEILIPYKIGELGIEYYVTALLFAAAISRKSQDAWRFVLDGFLAVKPNQEELDRFHSAYFTMQRSLKEYYCDDSDHTRPDYGEKRYSFNLSYMITKE